MSRLICPYTGQVVDAPSEASAAKLMAAGYRLADEPKPKTRRRTAKPKAQAQQKEL